MCVTLQLLHVFNNKMNRFILTLWLCKTKREKSERKLFFFLTLTRSFWFKQLTMLNPYLIEWMCMSVGSLRGNLQHWSNEFSSIPWPQRPDAIDGAVTNLLQQNTAKPTMTAARSNPSVAPTMMPMRSWWRLKTERGGQLSPVPSTGWYSVQSEDIMGACHLPTICSSLIETKWVLETSTSSSLTLRSSRGRLVNITTA